jgi:hypothetical protein
MKRRRPESWTGVKVLMSGWTRPRENCLLVSGKSFARRAAKRGDLAVGLLDGEVAAEETDDGGRVTLGAAVGAVFRRELGEERNPDLLVLREGEAGRHDADDGGGAAVEADGLAEDIGDAAEVGLPELVGDEGGLFRAGLIVGGGEVASAGRGYAEDFQEVFRDVGAGEALGIALIGEVDGGAVDVGGDELEGFLGGGDFLVVEGEDLAVVAEKVGLRGRGVDELDAGEAVGVGERKAAEHDAVDDGELRGDGADAEGEDGDGEGAEAFFFEEDAEAEAEVLEEGVGEHEGEGERAGRMTNDQ